MRVVSTSSNPARLSIVVPCYNEEEVLPETISRLTKLLQDLINKNIVSTNSLVLFVDDGSQDKTWEIIQNSSKQNPYVYGLKLSRNFGHQNALLAGMEYVADKCDCCITIDADLQDDIDAIYSMIDKFYTGCDIVYGVKSKRDVDSFTKRFTAESYYKLLSIFGVNIIYNHADFRLLSRNAISMLLKFPEKNLFLRGLIPCIGLKFDKVLYELKERLAGTPKYSFVKSFSLAWNGITSFTTVPLKIISILGFTIFLLSTILIIYIFYVALFTNKTIPGWASTVLPIYFIGGIQLLSIGIIGEYIGKIYFETKNRPRYLIEKICKPNENNENK